MKRRDELTVGNLGDLVSALELAMEFTRSLMNAELPTSRRDWEARDRDNHEVWTQNLRVFGSLRRRLSRAEKRALAVSAARRGKT